MLFGTFIHILTSLIRDFCTSDRNFASTFFQIPPHDGHPWSWLVVGHCDYNPHNRLSLSRYMPCPAYQIGRLTKVSPVYFVYGNHKSKTKFTRNKLNHKITKNNIIILNDQEVHLNNITLIGRKDYTNKNH